MPFKGIMHYDLNHLILRNSSFALAWGLKNTLVDPAVTTHIMSSSVYRRHTATATTGKLVMIDRLADNEMHSYIMQTELSSNLVN